MNRVLLNLYTFKFTALTILLILVLSLANTERIETPQLFMFKGADKLIHVMMYAGLTLVFLAERSHLFTKHKSYKPVKLYSVLWIFALGGIIEIIQPIMSGRDGDWIDFFANCGGSLLVYLTFPLLVKPLFK